MQLNDLILQRFRDLEKERQQIPTHLSGEQVFADYQSWHKWTTSVLHILGSVLGKDSIHYENFKLVYDRHGYDKYALQRATGIFQAAKEDYEKGYLFDLESSLTGEILGDFVMLAKKALTEGHKDVAAVLACAALEDTLKKYATIQGLEVSNKDMHEVINALKSKKLVTGAQKGLLDTMPKLRDYAMHANWDKITLADVGSVIGFVENFLLGHFPS